MKSIFKRTLLGASIMAIAACTNSATKPDAPSADVPPVVAFASTYTAAQHAPFVIRNVNLLVGNGEQLEQVDVAVSDGVITAVGKDLIASGESIDGSGKWMTPGLIDVHSHMGVYPQPETRNHADGNEMTSPVTAEVWAEHSVWPGDPAFEKARAGGVTTVQILPGSANLFGGRSVTLKNVHSVTVQGMKFPEAPYGLKMACGENPKRVYGSKGQLPSTRMGNVAGYRKAWIEAQDYRDKWTEYEEKKAAGKEAKAPKRDLKLETLVGVLEGEILIQNHCYRADEMAQMIDIGKEFGYKITAFHHAIEAYKVAPLLAAEGVCSVMWADWWGFKQEAYDMVRENIALVEYAKGCAVIHSDDPIQIQRLNQEVAKALAAGQAMGIDLDKADAIRWLTLNAAKAIGLEDKIGSVESGKNADLVLWDRDPFSSFASPEQVWIDGATVYQKGATNITADFNIGIITPEENRP
jgi:imidazolonepropionase-like amidohydrolase